MLSRTIYKKQRGRRLLTALATVSMVTGTFVGASTVLAVHDTGSFELDGNAVTTVSDDWDQICYQVTSNALCGTTTPALANTASWTGDILNGGTDVFANDPNATIFTGGGSKDPIDISSWAWKDGAGGLPDKDNLSHSFAARYNLPTDTVGTDGTLCPSGTAATCDVLYFGSDRFDNSGDAQQGFWFFQNKITLGNVNRGGGFSFNGVHKNGDVLVISDFSNGGTTSTITVYKWNSAVSGNLQQLATSVSANCATAGAGDGFCGIVNATNGTVAPWPFTDKSGNTTYLQGELYEGGINLSTLGLSNECFSSVAAETRSSTSTTATLKDFVLGQFASCTPTLTTAASTNGSVITVSPGTAVHDTATITIAGSTSAPDPTGTVTFSYCFNATSVPTCTATGNTAAGTGLLGDEDHNGVIDDATPNDGLAKALSDDVNTAGSPLPAGYYCFRATWPGDTNYPGALNATNQTTECFRVQDTSGITTAQKWTPNDTATVTTGSGAAASGTVVFTLYSSANCTGTELGTFTDTTAPFATNNSTLLTTITTVSWRAVFTPTDPNAVVGSTSHCETTSVTINNDIGS